MGGINPTSGSGDINDFYGMDENLRFIRDEVSAAGDRVGAEFVFDDNGNPTLVKGDKTLPLAFYLKMILASNLTVGRFDEIMLYLDTIMLQGWSEARQHDLQIYVGGTQQAAEDAANEGGDFIALFYQFVQLLEDALNFFLDILGISRGIYSPADDFVEEETAPHFLAILRKMEFRGYKTPVGGEADPSSGTGASLTAGSANLRNFRVKLLTEEQKSKLQLSTSVTGRQQDESTRGQQLGTTDLFTAVNAPHFVREKTKRPTQQERSRSINQAQAAQLLLRFRQAIQTPGNKDKVEETEEERQAKAKQQKIFALFLLALAAALSGDSSTVQALTKAMNKINQSEGGEGSSGVTDSAAINVVVKRLEEKGVNPELIDKVTSSAGGAKKQLNALIELFKGEVRDEGVIQQVLADVTSELLKQLTDQGSVSGVGILLEILKDNLTPALVVTALIKGLGRAGVSPEDIQNRLGGITNPKEKMAALFELVETRLVPEQLTLLSNALAEGIPLTFEDFILLGLLNDLDQLAEPRLILQLLKSNVAELGLTDEIIQTILEQSGSLANAIFDIIARAREEIDEESLISFLKKSVRDLKILRKEQGNILQLLGGTLDIFRKIDGFFDGAKSLRILLQEKGLNKEEIDAVLRGVKTGEERLEVLLLFAAAKINTPEEIEALLGKLVQGISEEARAKLEKSITNELKVNPIIGLDPVAALKERLGALGLSTKLTDPLEIMAEIERLKILKGLDLSQVVKEEVAQQEVINILDEIIAEEKKKLVEQAVEALRDGIDASELIKYLIQLEAIDSGFKEKELDLLEKLTHVIRKDDRADTITLFDAFDPTEGEQTGGEVFSNIPV